MKVTRDVIYDLLPAYFAGDASADTRALVEAYFQTDPEFGRMAARFQTLIAERQGPGAAADARERETFACARAAVELPQKTLVAALACGFVSLVAFGFAFLTSNGRLGPFHPGIVMGVVFAVMGVVFCVLSFRIKPDSWWRDMVGLDDAALDSLAMRHRPRRRRNAP